MFKTQPFSSCLFWVFILLLQWPTAGHLQAQEDLAIGQWREYLPFQFGRYIAQSEEKVFFTTDFAVLEVDKQDFSLRRITKVEGLSDVGTAFVKYIDVNDALLVTYTNSSFDLVKPSGVNTFVNIANDGNFFNREINDLTVVKDSIVFFSTGFGVVEFNTSSETFGFTANFAIEVYATEVFNGYIYASTEDGIYRGLDAPNVNLKDLSNWELLDISNGFPAVYSTNTLKGFEGNLYMDINDTLFTFNGQDLTKIQYEPGYDIRFMSNEGAHLLVGYYCLNTCAGKVHNFDSNGSFGVTGQGIICIDRPLYCIEDQFGQLWFADEFREPRVSPGPGQVCSKIPVNSPWDQRVTDIIVDEGNVFVATEPTLISPIFTGSGFYILSDGNWETFNNRFYSELNGMAAYYRMAVNPDNKKVYCGTFWDGLIEYDGTNITIFSEGPESLLEPSVFDPNVVRVGGLAFDEENNLWMSNHTAQRPIVVLRNDGTWKNDFVGVPSAAAIRQLVIDQSGNKWFTVDGNTQGVFVFNEGDIDNPMDNQTRFINISNSQLPTNSVNCLEVDLDGDVWVGTSEGPVVFECGSSVFDQQCTGSKRIVDVGGFAAFLLEDENIATIAVDGANRKWFGTENGVFIQSASGEEQVAFLNKDNSPLFDNSITDIAINPKNGEAFIGTAKGLISYRSEAVEGGIVNEANVYAYPNPVRPEYTGPIAIKGLARDANVKITDINGQLVYETTALGGQAIWDGRDYNGRKAATGVYLVFSTSTQNRENPDTAVAKILFMN